MTSVRPVPSADQADRDARLVFTAWGVEIAPLQPATGGEAEAATGGAAGEAAETDAATAQEAPATEKAAGGD